MGVADDRAVSSGSSAIAVPDPTAMASTGAHRMRVPSESSELMRVRSPTFAATRLSRLVAAFMITNGRCSFEREVRAVQAERALAPAPTDTSMPL